MATVNVWAQRAAKARQGPQPPPPPAPTKVVHRPVVTDPWPTVTSANGQPPKKPTPPASPSAASSTLATPAFSSPANSGAVSPAEPAKASGSGSTSSSARSPAPSTSNIPPNSSAKTKPRKWVPIPPEELRAAAQQQQRTNPTNHRNGRKSQSHSGTTSRAESVVSLDRDRDQQRDNPQPVEQQTDYTSSNGWTYEPPREPYYSQPYQYPNYWSANPPIPSDTQDDSKEPLPIPEPPPHNHYRDGWRPLYWWLNGPAPSQPADQSHPLPPPPPQTVEPQQQAQPPNPNSSSLPTSRVILFGTVDAESIDLGVDALTKTEPKRRRQPAALPASVTVSTLQLHLPVSSAAIQPSTSDPAHTRVPESGWRTTEAVWPVEPSPASGPSSVDRKQSQTGIPTVPAPNSGGSTDATSVTLPSSIDVSKASSHTPSLSLSIPAGLPLSASKPALFSIGVSPRARALRLTTDPGVEVVDLTVALGTSTMNRVGEQESAGSNDGGPGLGGLWEFGTTRSGDTSSGVVRRDDVRDQTHRRSESQPQQQAQLQPQPTQQQPPPPASYGYPVWGYPYDMGMYGYPQHAEGMPPPPHPLAMMPPPLMMGMGSYGPPPHSTELNGSGSASVSPTAERPHGSEWEVRDFGYGFGNSSSMNGSFNADLVRASVLRQPHDYEPSPAPEERPTGRDFDGPVHGRPRRGSYSGGFEPRGGYNGRRARGGFRGSYRGYNGNRGGNSGWVYEPPRLPSFNTTPNQTYAPMDDYYAMPSYYSAPPPSLRTRLSFPIDRLRMEILSQLEFYLSPDNMAQDLYLRQQMDSQGWVRIETLASFKRVQAKTTDVNLVRDVLGLSHYAEIRGDWVRSTDGWEKFVLPTAAPSVVEEQSSLLMRPDKASDGGAPEEEEEEEEDVVFVMDREAQAWSPTRPR